MQKTKCSNYFFYEDFFYCSDTWQESKVENIPQSPSTYSAIEQLATNILDPIVDEFGPIQLTYGFCSQALANRIKKNKHPRIALKLDQHAGYEINQKGNRICERDGIACDFIVKDKDMLSVSRWIVINLDFDRLYFYSNQRPIHISYAPDNIRQIICMNQYRERLIPKVMSLEEF